MADGGRTIGLALRRHTESSIKLKAMNSEKHNPLTTKPLGLSAPLTKTQCDLKEMFLQ
jgi:hypothetical protein